MDRYTISPSNHRAFWNEVFEETAGAIMAHSRGSCFTRRILATVRSKYQGQMKEGLARKWVNIPPWPSERERDPQ
jgi:hypothetical protein